MFNIGSLQTLSLAFNSFSGTLHSSVGDKLSNLNVFSIAGNILTGLFITCMFVICTQRVVCGGEGGERERWCVGVCVGGIDVVCHCMPTFPVSII